MLPNIAKFGVPNFSWYEMYKRSSLQMSDSIDRMGWPMAIGPEMINVGAHCKEARGLPEEFRKFVEDPRSKGVDNINAKTNALLVISFGYISI
jgi:hypothetical protein